MSFRSRSPAHSHVSLEENRLRWLAIGFLLVTLGLLGRFFQLQWLERETYRVLASDQHTLQKVLTARRGTVYMRDQKDGKLYPVAIDRDAWQIYAIPREMKDPVDVAKKAAALLSMPESDLIAQFTATSSRYLVLQRDAAYAQVEAVRGTRLPGIGVQKGLTRYYPEEGIGGQVLGFVGQSEENDRVGRYGIEGFYNELLSGKPGRISAERDATGRRLTIGSIDISDAEDGSDLVLTIDRAIQYEACKKASEAVTRFRADQATIIVVRPDDGSLLAMCSAPNFDSANYRKVSDIAVLNNPATFYQFEPGSIFKPLTMAAGIDTGKITPYTTYTDTGEEKIDRFTIRNSDKKAHGLQTMTEVLEKSLNTGTIFVQRLVGAEMFRTYIEKFGFGEKTGIGLAAEVKGNIAPLKKGGIFAATGSFGQGIAVTPLQMVMSFVPLANGGTYYKPRLVEAIRTPDGNEEKKAPVSTGTVISSRTARLVTAMMQNVVENGHGKKAGVPGYYVAGKTGTAQIPNPNGNGYLPDATIGSFAGYAPAEDPKFVMLVKIDRPRTVQFAESSAAPIFGEMAQFLLSYFEVPPERPIRKPTPPATAATTTAVTTPALTGNEE